ncbi:hypothetical protein ACWERF_16560 [Streptomyces griseoluteus]
MASGQTLATYSSDAAPQLLSDGRTLAAFVTSASGTDVDLFDLQTGQKIRTLPLRSSGDWTNTCDITLVPKKNGTGSLIVSTSVVARPAEGINPARGTLTVHATDAVTSKSLWSTDVEKNSTHWASSCDPAKVKELKLQATSDLVFGLLSPGYNSYLVNLADGSVRHVKDDTVVVDRWLGLPGDNSVAVEDPASQRRLGSLPSKDALQSLHESPGWVAADRARLIHVNDQGDGQTVGYSLPTGKRSWSFSDAGASAVDLDSTTHTAIIYDSGGGSIGDFVAVDVSSGKVLWKIASTQEYCGIADGRVYVLVNDQLAVLDARTKKQLRYDAKDPECPDLVDGAVMYTDEQPDSTTDYEYRITAP